MRRDNFTPTTTSYLCGQHFTDDQFTDGSRLANRKCLKTNAIPTGMFCWFSIDTVFGYLFVVDDSVLSYDLLWMPCIDQHLCSTCWVFILSEVFPHFCFCYHNKKLFKWRGTVQHAINTMGDFTFWISPWLRPNTNLTTQLWSLSRPKISSVELELLRKIVTMQKRLVIEE